MPRLATLLVVVLATSAGAAQPRSISVQPEPVLPDSKPAPIQPKHIGADTSPRPARSGREVDLRPRFRVGEPIWYRLVQTSNSTITSDGSDRSTESVQELELRFEAVSADPKAKTTTVEATIERVRMTLKADGQVTTHDTGPSPRRGSPKSNTPPPSLPSGKKPGEKPSDPQQPQPDSDLGGDALAGLLAPMVGSKTTFVLDQDGNITSMSGGSGLDIGSLMGGGVGGLGGAGPSQFGQIICPAPGRAWAAPGDSWRTTSELVSSPIGGVSITTLWSVGGVARGMANLKFSGSLASRSQDASIVRISDLTYNGTARWNAEVGRLAGMTSEMAMLAETALTGTPTKIQSRVSSVVSPLE